MNLDDAKSLGETLQQDKYEGLSNTDAADLCNKPFRQKFHQSRPENYFTSATLASSEVLGVQASATLLVAAKDRAANGSGQYTGGTELEAEKATYEEMIQLLRGTGMNAADLSVIEMANMLVQDPQFPLTQEQADKVLDLAYTMKTDSIDAVGSGASEQDVAMARQVHASTKNLLQAIGSLNNNYQISVDAILQWNGIDEIPPAYSA